MLALVRSAANASLLFHLLCRSWATATSAVCTEYEHKCGIERTTLLSSVRFDFCARARYALVAFVVCTTYGVDCVLQQADRRWDETIWINGVSYANKYDFRLAARNDCCDWLANIDCENWTPPPHTYKHINCSICDVLCWFGLQLILIWTHSVAVWCETYCYFQMRRNEGSF